MNVQYHYQLLLRREMGQLVNAARSLYREADRHITQVDQLRALVIEKDGIILWQNQPELYRLKYASPLQRAPTCFKRYNPLACRVTSR
jgi:hypothetical protein